MPLTEINKTVDGGQFLSDAYTYDDRRFVVQLNMVNFP